jgi:hypothetical protein
MRRGCPGGLLPVERSIHGGEQPLLIVDVVYGQSQPIGALPQICEETGAILVKMQKRFALDVKDARLALYQTGPVSQFQQEFAQLAESVCACVFHLRFSGAC